MKTIRPTNTIIFAISMLLCYSGFAQSSVFAPKHPEPVDGLVKKQALQDRRVLSYPSTQERDILWEKRVWREIDTRQKMNLPFRYAKAPLVKILFDEIRRGQITAYSPEDDKFSYALCWSDLKQSLFRKDSVSIIDPETYETFYETVYNDIHPEDIHKFRIKEVWWFDSKYSTMRVRILGIAPIKAIYDEKGKFLYEQPLFWVYYPKARSVLARHAVFLPQNDKQVLSWEDWFEMRYFDGTVYKTSNVHDLPLHAQYQGNERLKAAAQVDEEIRNFEADIWEQ